MVRSEFRELVLSICRYSGVSYIQDTVEINSLCNERLRVFSERTHCLYDDAIPFTLSTTVSGVFSYRSSAFFTRDLIEVHKVYIDSNPLYNFQSKVGLASLEEIAGFFPTYITDATSIPKYACQIPSNSLRLYPAPASAYSNCFVSAWFMPANITTTISGDSTEIGIPEEYQRTAAYFTAVALLIPTSTGEMDYQKIGMLNAEANNQMEALISKSRRQQGGTSIRNSIPRRVRHY